MEETFITYDKVEVGCRELVWYCYKDGIDSNGSRKDKPTPHIHQHDFVPKENDVFHYFSTKEACQAYIDSINEARNREQTFNMNVPKIDTDKIMPNHTIGNIGSMPENNPMYMQMYGTLTKAIVEGNPTHTSSSLHSILTQFATAYEIDINTVLQFIIYQKSK